MEDERKTSQENEGDEYLFRSPFSLHNKVAESELYKEEDNVRTPIVSVKRINLHNHKVNWEILQDDKLVLILRGSKFTKKECKFLETIDGMQFMVSGFKKGWASVFRFKQEMKRRAHD